MKEQFVLLEVGTQEWLREYTTLEEAFKDLIWKDPMGFWIGVIEEKQAYTIPEFVEKYKDEYDKIKDDLI